MGSRALLALAAAGLGAADGDIASAGAEAGGQVLAAAAPRFAPAGRLSRLSIAFALGEASRDGFMGSRIERGPWWRGKVFPVRHGRERCAPLQAKTKNKKIGTMRAADAPRAIIGPSLSRLRGERRVALAILFFDRRRQRVSEGVPSGRGRDAAAAAVVAVVALPDGALYILYIYIYTIYTIYTYWRCRRALL